jgi:hypothetical protein
MNTKPFHTHYTPKQNSGNNKGKLRRLGLKFADQIEKEDKNNMITCF